MVSDEVMMTALSYNFMTSLVVIAVIAIIAIALFEKSRSKKARELATDLYVIGTIRKLAAKDQIDLNTEMKEMRKIQKLDKLSFKELDQVIEDELKEKVQAEGEKAVKKIADEK